MTFQTFLKTSNLKNILSVVRKTHQVHSLPFYLLKINSVTSNVPNETTVFLKLFI